MPVLLYGHTNSSPMKLRVAALYSKQKPPHRLLLQTDGEAHYCHCSLSFLLLNHDLGLCPSSFLLCKRPSAERTFGKAQTSLAFHSLNHDLFTIIDIDAANRRFAVKLTSIERIPIIIINYQLSIINSQLSIEMIPVVSPSRNPFSHASRTLKVLEILFYFVRKYNRKGCLLDNNTCQYDK